MGWVEKRYRLTKDQPFEENINAHIYALGGFPALNLGSADLILMVNTPFKGATFEATGNYKITL